MLIVDSLTLHYGQSQILHGVSVTAEPGKVTAVFVSVGETVAAGQSLMILEAMKMEHPLKAAIKGTVHLSPITAGDQVKSKQTIATILQADEVIHE